VLESSSLKEDAARWLGLRLDESQLEALAWVARELSDWNRRFNLTAVDDPSDITDRHFLDSLSCLQALGTAPRGRLVDVGSGAGFPGIPIKIAVPELELTLIEATGKKAEFCRHVVAELGLRGAVVMHARVEEVGRSPDHRAKYDWAVARAVARLPTLVEYLLPLLKVKGLAIAPKGKSASAEAEAAAAALRLLGGRVQSILPVELPRVPEKRFLIVMEKTSPTPEKYPRRPGVAAKRPLA
jgi:16S rRNA (guanine527-N7)-methyltransferase